MSAENPEVFSSITVHAAARMYGNYLVEDLKTRSHPSYEAERAAGDPFFEASTQFVQAVQAYPQLKPNELGKTPEIDEAVNTIVKLPVGQSRLNGYAQASLLHACGLVADRYEHIPIPLRQSVYEHTIEHAITAQNMLQHPSSDKARDRLTHFLGGSIVTILPTRDGGLAMAPLAHQRADYKTNPHDGVLLGSPYARINAPVAYAVVAECGGFAEGHDPSNQNRIKQQYLRRVHILSMCCDLQLAGQSKQNTNQLVELLQDDAAGVTSPTEKALLSNLAQRVVATLVSDESRRGTQLTHRQRWIKNHIKPRGQ